MRAVPGLFALLRRGIVVPPAYRAGMFPPEAFGVGVTVAELRPALWDDGLLPAGVVVAAVPARRPAAGRS